MKTPRRKPGAGASKLHLALQKAAENARREIEMVVGVSAQANPNLNATSVVLFADLTEPQTRVFLDACGVEVGTDVKTFIGMAERYLVRSAVSSTSLKRWLELPVAPGYVPLLAIAGNGAGDLVCCHTDVDIPSPGTYSMTVLQPSAGGLS